MTIGNRFISSNREMNTRFASHRGGRQRQCFLLSPVIKCWRQGPGGRRHAAGKSIRTMQPRDGAVSRYRRLAGHRLAHFEAFELRMLEIKRTGCLIAGARGGGAKLLRSGPGLEGRFILPDGMRGVERVVFGLRPLEQMKLDEAGNAVEIRFARQPDFFERLLGALLDPKAVHGDEHALSPDYGNDDDWRSADHAVAKMSGLRKSSAVPPARLRGDWRARIGR